MINNCPTKAHAHVPLLQHYLHYSNDLEPTQMSINDRLDKENVAHIYHRILGIHKKERDYVFCINVDEAEGYYI